MKKRAIRWAAGGALACAIAVGTGSALAVGPPASTSGPLAAVQAAIAALQAGFADLVARMTAAEDAEAQMQADIAALQETVASLQEQIDALSGGGGGDDDDDDTSGGGELGAAFGDYLGETPASYSGDLGGYEGARDICTAQFGVDSGICSTAAIGPACVGPHRSMWGADSRPDHSDCQGWTTASSGAVGGWLYWSSHGCDVYPKSCNNVMPFACCRY